MEESVQYSYRIFDFSFSVSSDSEDSLRLFDLVYRNLRQKNGRKPHFAFKVITHKRKGGTPHLLAGQKEFPFHCFSSLESQVFKLLTDELYRRIKSHFLIHGGGVSFQDRGVMISGESGTGKTSLIVKLLTQGFQFLSDEVIPVNKKTGKMDPFPRAVGLRPEAKSWLLEGFSLFRQEAQSRATGHKYFLNPLSLGRGKIGSPAIPRYFLYLAKPKSTPERAAVVHLVIKARGGDFLSSIRKVKGIKVLKHIQREKDTYLRLEIPRKGTVMRKYLDEYEKYQSSIVHSERKKEEGVTFHQKPQIVPIPLSDMSLLLLKQLKEEMVDRRLRGDKFRSAASYWLYLVDALDLSKVKGYKIHVGRMKETTQFIQDLVK